mgnify:CR=1 FL=1
MISAWYQVIHVVARIASTTLSCWSPLILMRRLLVVKRKRMHGVM